jgi:hypothetical protein
MIRRSGRELAENRQSKETRMDKTMILATPGYWALWALRESIDDNAPLSFGASPILGWNCGRDGRSAPPVEHRSPGS